MVHLFALAIFPTLDKDDTCSTGTSEVTNKKYIPTPLLSMCRLCPKLEGWEEQTNAPFTKKYRERRRTAQVSLLD